MPHCHHSCIAGVISKVFFSSQTFLSYGFVTSSFTHHTVTRHDSFLPFIEIEAEAASLDLLAQAPALDAGGGAVERVEARVEAGLDGLVPPVDQAAVCGTEGPAGGEEQDRAEAGDGQGGGDEQGRGGRVMRSGPSGMRARRRGMRRRVGARSAPGQRVEIGMDHHGVAA
ncbi:hypothetical protein FLP41_03095 (plasmid) [Paracoccus marcusii]|uniref:hypothetical protein n=1 Tax=Paracoccus marcusii TaxID=59779 RepID=UPI002ED102ED|nr:hypothetical protein FLP41_03095 [Paracoccus marcusii]